MSENRHLFEGLRVVELATMVMAPSASCILADYGADVVKIESPGGGDPHRYGYIIKGMPRSEIPYTFEVDNRNKKSIVLDLRNEAGTEVFRALLTTADVFITNLRPAALERLGVGYESLKALNPRLIYSTAYGYGEKGPEKEKPGYDSICYWSRSGIESSMFPANDWLGAIPYGSGDHPSGLGLLTSIMFALYRREKTGEGAEVSTSLLASGVWSNSNMLMAQLCNAEFEERRPRDNAYNFSFLTYLTADERKFKLCMFKHEQLWEAFCRAIDRAGLLEDARFKTLAVRLDNMTALIEIVDEIFASQDAAYWSERFEEHDVPFTVLPTYEEVANDPQMAANDIFVEVDHPKYGRFRTVNSPTEIKGEPKVKPGPAPELGEHSVEVLADLGYSEKEIGDLLAGGAVEQYEDA